LVDNAGKQLLTGAQAECYAEKYIRLHALESSIVTGTGLQIADPANPDEMIDVDGRSYTYATIGGVVTAARNAVTAAKEAGADEEEVAELQAQADGLQARLPIAERDVTELREAAEAGAQAATLAEHAGVEAANLKAGIRAATAATEIARQNVRAAQLDFDARVVHSPVDGRVLRSAAHPDERVDAESADGLLQILPGGARMVRAELAEDDLATVHVGSEAEVSTDSDTSSSYPARVVRIAGILGPPTKDSDTTGSIDARAAECILTADKLPYLVGQRVIVRFRR
jgi:HlyD family secretion protein